MSEDDALNRSNINNSDDIDDNEVEEEELRGLENTSSSIEEDSTRPRNPIHFHLNILCQQFRQINTPTDNEEDDLVLECAASPSQYHQPIPRFPQRSNCQPISSIQPVAEIQPRNELFVPNGIPNLIEVQESRESSFEMFVRPTCTQSSCSQDADDYEVSLKKIKLMNGSESNMNCNKSPDENIVLDNSTRNELQSTSRSNEVIENQNMEFENQDEETENVDRSSEKDS